MDILEKMQTLTFEAVILKMYYKSAIEMVRYKMNSNNRYVTVRNIINSFRYM